MSVKHTPKPWRFKHEFARHYAIEHNGYWIGRMQGKENAQLASAAPDLLEALKTLADYVDEQSGDNEYRPLENARAAIDKATGKTP